MMSSRMKGATRTLKEPTHISAHTVDSWTDAESSKVSELPTRSFASKHTKKKQTMNLIEIPLFGRMSGAPSELH